MTHTLVHGYPLNLSLAKRVGTGGESCREELVEEFTHTRLLAAFGVFHQWVGATVEEFRCAKRERAGEVGQGE